MEKLFKEWACSFSGCDGGNIDADIWLCGIEWGGGSYDNGKYYKEELPKEIKKGKVENINTEFNWNESLTYPYGRSFAKLYQAISGNDVESYQLVSDLTNKELFKLNLYPIAFDSTNNDLWHENMLRDITGFENKYLFNTWCFFNRFPAFAKIRKEKKPKLVICTGVDYLRDFLMCFGGSENIDKLQTGSLIPKSETNKYVRTYYYVKVDDTLLVVIPFFSGRYGLNSNHLLQTMGDSIRELLQ